MTALIITLEYCSVTEVSEIKVSLLPPQLQACHMSSVNHISLGNARESDSKLHSALLAASWRRRGEGWDAGMMSDLSQQHWVAAREGI